jgi:hypothetical protein
VSWGSSSRRGGPDVTAGIPGIEDEHASSFGVCRAGVPGRPGAPYGRASEIEWSRIAGRYVYSAMSRDAHGDTDAIEVTEVTE